MSKFIPSSVKPFELDVQIPANPVSASEHVPESKYVEIFPSSSASDYSYNGTRQVDFDVNSNTHVVDWDSLYLRYDLKPSLKAAAADDTTKSLATGGGHAVFERVQLSLDGGSMEIHNIQNYNRLNAILSESDSAEYTETIGHGYGDSVNDSLVLPSGGVGTSTVDSARKFFANQGAVNPAVVCMPVNLPFFQTNQYCPLMFMKNGMRLSLHMARPQEVLQSRTAGTPTWTEVDVVISNPRLVVRMIRPSVEIVNDYNKIFQTTGLAYNYVDYTFNQDSVAGTSEATEEIPIRRSLSSVRSAYTVLQNFKGATITADSGLNRNVATLGYDSVGNFIKANLSGYSYNIGSERSPFQSGVDMTSSDNSEALRHYLDARGKLNRGLVSLRNPPSQWAERHIDSELEDGAVDSSKLILASRFSRYPDSPWTGIDSSGNQMTVNLSFDAVYDVNGTASRRYIRTFVEHDAMLVLQKDGNSKR